MERVPVPEGVDWICVSPKPHSVFKQTFGHELKLVYPQKEAHMTPEHFENLRFEHFFLQPMDGAELRKTPMLQSSTACTILSGISASSCLSCSLYDKRAQV